MSLDLRVADDDRIISMSEKGRERTEEKAHRGGKPGDWRQGKGRTRDEKGEIRRRGKGRGRERDREGIPRGFELVQDKEQARGTPFLGLWR